MWESVYVVSEESVGKARGDVECVKKCGGMCRRVYGVSVRKCEGEV